MMASYEPKPRGDYMAGRCGGLVINSYHLGFVNLHLNLRIRCSFFRIFIGGTAHSSYNYRKTTSSAYPEIPAYCDRKL